VLTKQDAPISEQDNMCFSGCSVSTGNGIGVVVRTGEFSEIGKISTAIQKIGIRKSPLQLKVNEMGKKVSVIVIVVSIILFLLLLYKKVDFGISLLLVASVLVAGIPESFPLSLTLTLSRGVKRMADNNAIVKNMSSVETLGTTTVICTDKTGTLTENRMMVQKLYFSDKMEFTVTGEAYTPNAIILLRDKIAEASSLKKYSSFFEACVLCNDSELIKKDNSWVLSGESTEGALLALSKSAKYDEYVLRKNSPRVLEVAFDPKKKFMVTVHNKSSTKHIIYMKGAGERVLERCTDYFSNSGKIVKMTTTAKHDFEKILNQYTSDGFRVLAVAYKEKSKCKLSDLLKKESDLEKGFTFLGFVAIADPIRKEVFSAIEECKSAGIDIIMITGDHASTARSIGQQLKIITSKRNLIIESSELEKMSNDKLDAIINKVSIFARATPEHKFRIVCSLQRKGEIVAMTGDGVNDAPALKEADIGISMGINGTQVAREASDMILRDDNFKTIVEAVREGRAIYSNIRRFVYYLLTTNYSQVSIIFIAVLLGFSNLMPLTPLMILYLNFITGTFPALALSVEPVHKKVMHQLPRRSDEKILSNYIMTKIMAIVPVMTFSALLLFLWELRVMGSSLERAMTVAFAVLAISGILHTFNARRLHSTIFESGFFKNRYIIYSVIASIGITILTIHSAAGIKIFETVPLYAYDWLMIFIFSGLVIVVSEMFKLSTKQELDELSMLHGRKISLE
jgi:Ca2+-transporting ATPase